MERTTFIFTIDAEKHYNVLVRIITLFNRYRIPVKEFNSNSKEDEDRLHITVSFEEHKDNAIKLSKKLIKEIDILPLTFLSTWIIRLYKSQNGRSENRIRLCVFVAFS